MLALLIHRTNKFCQRIIGRSQASSNFRKTNLLQLGVKSEQNESNIPLSHSSSFLIGDHANYHFFAVYIILIRFNSFRS